MSDWGKWIVEISKGKLPVIIVIFVAFVAFVPIDSFELLRVQFRDLLCAIVFFAIASIAGNILFWLKDCIASYVAKKREECRVERERAREDAKIWCQITNLNPDMQKFIVSLFSSGQMSRTARLNDPMIVALRHQGFLNAPGSGIQNMEDLSKPIGTVVLSKEMIDYMSRHSDEVRNLIKNTKTSDED